MRISCLLLLLLVGFVRGRERGTGPVPCFPKCPLSEEGRRLCESLSALKSCVESDKQQGVDGTIICSCQWAHVLSHPGYSHLLDNPECLKYSLGTCETKTRQIRDTAGSEYSMSDFLREMQNENFRIKQITDESKKQDAKIQLLKAVHDVIKLIKQLDAKSTEKPDTSEGTTTQADTTEFLFNLEKFLSGGWKTLPVTTKKPMNMHPLKDDKKFYIIMFAVVAMLIILVTVLCLVAKVTTLIEKLRIRNREKAEENAKRGQSSGNVRSKSKIAKPAMAVPSKGTVGKRNSNTSLKSIAGKRSDSCTMISGLTHGNTSGSDVEIDNEFRMFRTNFKKDFKSLFNVNKDEKEHL